MRPSCIECVRKHLAQAHILIMESHQGYPLHLYLALGHLAEAADEIYRVDPDRANHYRQLRKELEEGINRYNVIEELEYYES